MKKNERMNGRKRWLALFLVLSLLVGGIPPTFAADGAENAKPAANEAASMPICGVEPYAQGGAIQSAADVSYEGAPSLKASGRTETYYGAAWSIPAASLGDLLTNRHWLFSMWLRSASGEMSMTYNIEFWYSSGADYSKTKAITGTLTDSGWTELRGEFQLTEDYLTNLDHIVIYPVSGTDQLGDYYVGAISLTGADDMAICGVQPTNQGCTLSRTAEQVYTGNDSLKVTARNDQWSGAAWYVPSANLGALAATNRIWTLSMRLRAESGSMNMTYNLQFWYSANAADCRYLSCTTSISDGGWTELRCTWLVPADYTAGMTQVNIYPDSNGNTGNYYVDAVSLTGAPVEVDHLTICGVEPHFQGGQVQFWAPQDVLCDGRQAVRVTRRNGPWDGAAWSIPAAQLGELRTNRNWAFSMWLRTESGSTNMTYNLQFWYSDNVDNCKYLSCMTAINAGDWTVLSGNWAVSDEYLTDALQRIVIYPGSDGETPLDYYIGAISLQPADDMTICGAEPYGQAGAAAGRTGEQVFEGSDSIKATSRAETYSGVAWDIQAANLGDLASKRLWTLSMRLRSESGPMTMSYNLEFAYTDTSKKKEYLTGTVNLTDSGWTELARTWEIPEAYLEGLEHIVVYPTSGAGQLGDYYVDAVSLTGVDALNGAEVTEDTGLTGGGTPYAQECATRNVNTPSHGSDQVVEVFGRAYEYSGLAWRIPADQLGTLKDNLRWTLSMQLQMAGAVTRAAGTMDMTYNLQFWYSGNSNDCKYKSCTAAINPNGWTELKGTFDIPAEWMNGLTQLVIYPVSGAGQLNSYYVAAASLTGEEVPPEPPAPPVTDIPFVPVVYDDMKLCGAEPYGQVSGLRRATSLVYTGSDSLYSVERKEVYSGAAWSIPAANLGALRDSEAWKLSMQLRSAQGPMDMTYNLEFWYSDGSPNRYLSASAAITDSGWTELKGVWLITDEYINSALDHIVIYPVTGEGQLGNYYLDGVSLTAAAASEVQVEPERDDMRLCGAEPYGQVGTIQQVEEPVYAGGDSILAQERTEVFSGVAWSIPAASLGTLKDNRSWTLSMQLRSAQGPMDMTYNLEFWYNDGSPNRYLSASAAIADSGWTELKGTWLITDEYINNALDRIVIYPVTGEGQLGNYYLDGVSLTGTAAAEVEPDPERDDMRLCGAEPYGQAGTIQRVEEPVYSGGDSILARERSEVYSGAAWSIPAASLGTLKDNRSWTLSMQLRSAQGPMDMTYNLEFWYSDGSENRYLSASAAIADSGWTELKGTWLITDEYLTETLDRVVIYPTAGEGQLGDYYVDSVSLTGEAAPVVTVDDMTIGGKNYFVHGDGTITRTGAVKYVGEDSLLVSQRSLPYSGAGWDVRELLAKGGAGTWRFTAYAITADGSALDLSYSVYLKYTDGRENWLYCGGAHVTGKGWTRISGEMYSTTDMAMDFDGLEIATLYPCTEEGQLGAYYIDGVSLTRIGNAIPIRPAGEDVPYAAPAYDYDEFPLDGGFEQKLALGQVGHPFAHGAPVKLAVTSAESYAGGSALLVSDRTLAYSGAGYDVTSYLKNQGWGNWFFHAYAKAVDEPVTLHYCIYLRFEDGMEDWLQPATRYYVTSDAWRAINTDFMGGDALLASTGGYKHDFSTLEQATLYPCTGEGELGAYYLDDVKLYRGADDYEAPAFTYTHFPLDGTFEDALDLGAPGRIFLHGEGASLSRTDTESHGGEYSLLVSDRASSYSGAGWVVTDYLKQEGWGNWYFSCYAKAVDGGDAIALQYSIYLLFEDGTEHWLNSNQFTYLTTKMWSQINVDTAGNSAVLAADDGSTYLDFDALTYAVLYPNTVNSESGYYIDDARLWREDIPEEKGDAPVIQVPVEKEPEPPKAETPAPVWPWVAGAVVILAAAAALAAAVILRKKQKKTLD